MSAIDTLLKWLEAFFVGSEEHTCQECSGVGNMPLLKSQEVDGLKVCQECAWAEIDRTSKIPRLTEFHN